MSLISYNIALGAEGNVSDYTHIKDYYDQVSDGTREIHTEEIYVVDSISATSLNNDSVRPKQLEISLTNGSLVSEYVNSTMESQGYLASNYQNSIALVHSPDSPFNSQLVKSVKYDSNSWKWILISLEGTSW